MTRTIQRLADRMVARLVPASQAAAISCSYDWAGCWRRTCCSGAGVPGGGLSCSGWTQWC
ncbi:hypothetical protein [Microbispora sp. ATCC PTA-5024]|uniref:hypothetical protein n=1 Tax=Microbispora sp. ATCC PTA-5024 TaxID=316330 RepID=UPI0012EDE8C2|nr:hypothetical protein [Microbispora sp. ATCC PTA-5024]